MSSYLNTLEAAFYLFPVIAALITLPYLFYANRRFGGIPFLRAFVFYTFVLYLTCCYVLVIFPLPTAAELAEIGSKTMDLRVFGFVDDLQNYSSFMLSDPSTWIASLHEQVVYQVFFNLIMLIPFGIYMHYYFRKGFFFSILMGFLLSLSFELIQLSALFGLYPHPYRLFQIDDLILNTAGAGIGWILSPLISWMFPSQLKLNQISQGPKSTIEPYRRIVAAAVDFFIFFLVMNLISHVPGLGAFDIMGESRYYLRFLAYAVGVLLYFAGLSYLFGATPGKMIFGLRIVTRNGKRPSFEQLLIRYALEMVVALPAPFIAVKVYSLSEFANSFIDAILFMVTAVLLIFFAVFAFQILISVFTGNMMLFSERLSGTGIVRAGEAAGKKRASSSRRTRPTENERRTAQRRAQSSQTSGSPQRVHTQQARRQEPNRTASRPADTVPQRTEASGTARTQNRQVPQDTSWLFEQDPYGRDGLRDTQRLENPIFQEEPLSRKAQARNDDVDSIFQEEDPNLVTDDVLSHLREKQNSSNQTTRKSNRQNQKSRR